MQKYKNTPAYPGSYIRVIIPLYTWYVLLCYTPAIYLVYNRSISIHHLYNTDIVLHHKYTRVYFMYNRSANIHYCIMLGLFYTSGMFSV